MGIVVRRDDLYDLAIGSLQEVPGEALSGLTADQVIERLLQSGWDPRDASEAVAYADGEWLGIYQWQVTNRQIAELFRNAGTAISEGLQVLDQYPDEVPPIFCWNARAMLDFERTAGNGGEASAFRLSDDLRGSLERLGDHLVIYTFTDSPVDSVKCILDSNRSALGMIYTSWKNPRPRLAQWPPI